MNMFGVSKISKVNTVFPCIFLCAYGSGLLCLIVGSVDVVPEVTVEQGKLSGSSFLSREGREYFGFRGIPYGIAKRFEPAKPYGHWSGIWDATSFGSKCAHIIYGFASELSSSFGTEDCLFLNVYVPSRSFAKENHVTLFPVIMYIHGGGFSLGSGEEYDPSFFMDEDVIFVTMNYRLGAFGFLSTGDGLIEGNLGLKDQLLSIKWVKNNIDKFGGDANRITISGQSAGAGSVGHLLLSPLSTGLFSSAIMVSGSALCPWALNYKPEVTAKELATAVNCPIDNNKNMVDCLKAINLETIFEPQKEVKWFMEYKYPFFPSVEFQPPKDGHEILLPDYPINLLQRGVFQKVPLMIGMDDDEGIMVSNFVGSDEEMMAELTKNWTALAPTAFYYDILPVSATRLDSASEKIRKFYFGLKPVTRASLQNLTNVISDLMFTHGIQKTAKYHSGYAPTFPYLFNLREISELTSFGAYHDVPIVTHGSELPYLFKLPLLNTISSDEQMQLSKNLVKLWVSFAATGEPRETWGNEKKWNRLTLTPQEVKNGDGIDLYQLNFDTTLLKKPFNSRFKFVDYLTKHELKFP